MNKEKDLTDFKLLLEKSERWHRTENLRAYITEVERRAGDLSEDLQQWLDWAKKKADWYDPFVEREDEVLGNYSELKS